MYRITVDKRACDGVFACLTRDPRFAEGEGGLATVDADDALTVRESETVVVAEFADDRLPDARRAAAACPPDAISVEEVEEPCR